MANIIHVEAIKEFDCPTHHLKPGKRGYVPNSTARAGIERGYLKEIKDEEDETEKRTTPEKQTRTRSKVETRDA